MSVCCSKNQSVHGEYNQIRVWFNAISWRFLMRQTWGDWRKARSRPMPIKGAGKRSRFGTTSTPHASPRFLGKSFLVSANLTHIRLHLPFSLIDQSMKIIDEKNIRGIIFPGSWQLNPNQTAFTIFSEWSIDKNQSEIEPNTRMSEPNLTHWTKYSNDGN